MAPKRTEMFSILSYFVIFFASFYVLKARPLTPDGISNTLDYIDFYDEIKESFIYSSMHLFHQDHRFKKIVTYNYQNISLFTTLLLLCGDIETCPGPVTLSVCKCRNAGDLNLCFKIYVDLCTILRHFKLLLIKRV